MGGNESWTRCPNLCPNKLKRITPLMEILWKNSWKINHYHVKVICSIRKYLSFLYVFHKELCVGEDSWTVSELIEAVGITYRNVDYEFQYNSYIQSLFVTINPWDASLLVLVRSHTILKQTKYKTKEAILESATCWEKEAVPWAWRSSLGMSRDSVWCLHYAQTWLWILMIKWGNYWKDQMIIIK